MNVLLTDEQKINAANSDDLFQVMRQILVRDNKLATLQEHFWIVGLTEEYVIDFVELIGLGQKDKMRVTMSKVFKNALIRDIKRVIFVHSVTDDNLEPTEYDLVQTKQLSSAATLLDIIMLNHMIINTKDYNSFL